MLTKHVKRAAVAALMAATAACAGDPIAESLSVAPGLNPNAVELAVLMAVANAGAVPAGAGIGQPIDDRTIALVVGPEGTAPTRHNRWYFESRGPGSVYAGYERHGGYLRVEVTYAPPDLRFTAVEDRDVHHTRNVLAVLDDLRDRVSRSLRIVQQAAMKQQAR